MHVSETDIPRGEKPSQFFKEGDPITVKVLRIEPAEQRIGLSSRGSRSPRPPRRSWRAPAAEPEKPVPAGPDSASRDGTT